MTPLSTILKSFGLEKAGINPIKSGMINKSYLVTNGKKFVLREIDEPNEKKLDFEIKFIEHLKRNNVHVPKIIKTNDNKNYIRKEKLYLLQTFIAGKKSQYSHTECELIASELAKMHLASEKLDLTKLPTFKAEDLFSFDFDQNVEKKYYPPFINIHPEMEIKLKRVVEIRKQITNEMNLKKDKLNSGIIHNDLSNENIIITDNQAFFIDFDFICKGKYVSDIASALYYAILTKQKSARSIISNFLKDYNSIRPITIDEKNILNKVIMHQHIINTNFLIKRIQNTDDELLIQKIIFNLDKIDYFMALDTDD